jgi:hypothetical protein
MKFCAHCLANMLQNVSQNRENKKITLNDIRYVMTGAYQAFYPGTTMFSLTSSKPFRHHYCHWPNGFIHCVKGNGNGTASVLWSVIFYTHDRKTPQMIEAGTRVNHYDSIIRTLKNVSPEQIYKGLKISGEEIKIMVECAVIRITDSHYELSDGRKMNAISDQEAFGFFMLNPQKVVGGSGSVFYNTIVIFTPRPGLFDETPPT